MSNQVVAETGISLSPVITETKQILSKVSGYETQRGNIETAQKIADKIILGIDNDVIISRYVAQFIPSDNLGLGVIESQIKESLKVATDFALFTPTSESDFKSETLTKLPERSGVIVDLNYFENDSSPKKESELISFINSITQNKLLPVFQYRGINPDRAAPKVVQIARAYFSNAGGGFFACSFSDPYLKEQTIGVAVRVCTTFGGTKNAASIQSFAARSLYSSPPSRGSEVLTRYLLLNDSPKFGEVYDFDFKASFAIPHLLDPFVGKDLDPIMAQNAEVTNDEKNGKVFEAKWHIGVNLKDGLVVRPVVAHIAHADTKFQNRKIPDYDWKGVPKFLDAMERFFSPFLKPDINIQGLGGTNCIVMSVKTEKNLLDKTPKIIIPNMCWPNIESIFAANGYNIETYKSYSQESSKGYSIEETLDSIKKTAKEGDAIYLDPIRNPNGLKWGKQDFRKICELAAELKLTIFFDDAYRGYGEGFEKDGDYLRIAQEYLGTDSESGIQRIYASLSLSKTFGAYRDRLAALQVFTADKKDTFSVEDALEKVVAISHGKPPEEIASLFAFIVNHEEYSKDLFDDIENDRKRFLENATHLKNQLLEIEGLSREVIEEYFENTMGMFRVIPLLKPQAGIKLYEEYNISILKGEVPRVAVSAITDEDQVAHFCNAIKKMWESDARDEFFYKLP